MELRATFVLLWLCIALAYGQNKQGSDGMWGKWGDPSECSRTCGGGVLHRTRKCHHGMRPGVSRGCQGDDIMYESCNSQPCPDGLDSFRTVQCARFNDEKSTWRPYLDDHRMGSSHRCQLVCQDSRTGQVEVLQERVVDGTECDSPLSLGICLGGLCQNMGCDRRIGSQRREDKCLECGGRGDGCQLVSGTLTQDDLSLGDNDVVIIPQGSTSISLLEVSAFPSLVVTGQEGGGGGEGPEEYLNSRQPPANGTVLRAAGTSLLFTSTELPSDGTQRQQLMGRGPTNDTLIIKLRDYGREKTSIEYKYYVSKNRLLESNPSQPYSWVFGAWTGCSQECGDGYQLRAVSCIDRSTGASVDDSQCEAARKPDARKECNVKPCGTADNWYRWVPGHWGKCSVQCGVGEQTQEMYCVESGPAGDTVYVKEDLCERYGDKHPVYKRACEGDGEECPYWASTAWSECSVTCGHGTKTRQVLCQVDPLDPSGDPRVLQEEEQGQCPQERPDTHEACQLDPCPDGSNAHGMVQVEDDKDCETSEHGCCADGVTFATGPSGEGCPTPAPTDYNVCLLEPERGACSDYSIKWHFVPKEKECRRFWYGGCQGNGNRFATEEECVAKCLQKDKSAEDLASGDCRSRVHGCCPDGVTAARGPNKEGCPNVDSSSESHCQRSRYGCCEDGVTEASGPNQAGCQGVVVVVVGDSGDNDGDDNDNDRDDNVVIDNSSSSGNNNNNNNNIDDDDNSGSEAACRRSKYGCCDDGVTAARGLYGHGCPENEGAQSQGKKKCEQSYYGCCPGSDVAATGPNHEGCDSSSAATTDFDPAVCSGGEDRGTCTDYSVKWFYDSKEARCKRFWYGGCAGNGNVFDSEEQCTLGCVDVTGPALCRLPAVTGPCRASHPRYFFNHKVGKCQRFTYGGCKGNTNRFLTLGECQSRCRGAGGADKDRGDSSSSSSSSSSSASAHEDRHRGSGGHDGSSSGGGGSADGKTTRGNEILPSNQVDQCAQTRYGCCRDGVTPARGLNFRGCPQPCQTSRYGCCADRVTPAQGYNREGCPERDGDEERVGVGAEEEEDDGSGVMGDCEETRYGCCPDGLTAAVGPNMRGCPSIPTPRPRPRPTPRPRPRTTTTTTTTTPSTTTKDKLADVVGDRERCVGASERGPCTNYEVKWYFNTERQECARFWYGGCPGNENRFDNRDECEAECLATEAPVTEDPDFVSICDMPQEAGPCRGRLARWYYDRLDRQCRTFYWTGCQGNENNFLSLQQCQQTCMGVAPPTAAPVTRAPAPTTTTTTTTTSTTTTPAPYTFNPPPQSSSLVMTGSEEVLEGQELRLTCSASGPSGVPREIEWFIDGKRVGREHEHLSVRAQPTPSEHRLVSELLISRAREADSAAYYCRSVPYLDVRHKVVSVVKSAEVRTTTQPPVTARPEVPTDSGDPLAACKLPAETGMCRGYFPRWHYDADTGTCKEFVYGGCQGNSNNFESQQDCMEFCHRKDDHQPRPRPRPDPDTRDESSDPQVICSMPAVTGECRANLRRWHYDAAQGRCHQFVYGGCSGNNNNFETESDCLNYCSNRGGSRPDPVPVTEAPVVSSDPNVVCQQPAEPGNCRAYIPRYHYDPLQGQCVRFTYGGCGANSNNFETEEACNQYCRAEDICRQPKVIGPCRGGFQRYFYDAASGACRQFIYGGCQGNLNNFGTQQACQQKCASHGSSSASSSSGVGPGSRSKEVCKLNPDAGTCRGYDIKWYYDSFVQRCQRFVYTGCDGNGNRFSSEAECLQFCRTDAGDANVVVTPAPTQPSGDECSLTPDRGRCTDYEIYWYYDAARGRCKRFYYGGCEGNANRFISKERCQERCTRAGPVATTTTRAPDRRRPCSYSRHGCCQDGYTPAVDAFRTNCRDDGVVVRPSGDGNVVLATRGSLARLDCNSPGRAVSWYRDGYVLMSDSRFHIHNNGTLIIRNIDDDLSGFYACHISDGNNIPEVRRYELKLKDSDLSGNRVPLSVLMTPPTIKVAPGDNTYLHCQATGTPTPTLSWTFQGAPIYSGGRYVVFNNGTLMVTAATERDAGTYKCTAQNGVDTPVFRDMQLVIAQKLKAEIQSHSGVAMEGETVRLRCDVSGYPPPSVTWEKNGVPVTSRAGAKAYQQGDNLVVPQVGIEDAGVYTCVGTNSLGGSARDITYLQVQLQSHRDKCVNSMNKMKCHLIVTARLCGHRMFARKCCQSCRQAGLLRRK